MEDNTQLLRAGIAALKAGQREKAQKLLMRVVEQDEQNEKAWLWLSGAVTTNEDRRICLDNVLAINPDNKMAQKELVKLGPSPQKEASPPTPALELESNKPDDYSKPFYETEALIKPEPKQLHHDDVWNNTADICAYCATPVERNDKRCPNCNHKLIGKELRRIAPSKHHRVLMILRIINHLVQFLGLVLFLIVIQESLFSSASGIFFTFIIVGAFIAVYIPSGIVTAGIYFRKIWAYWLIVIGFILSVILYALRSTLSTLPSDLPSASYSIAACFLIPGILYQVFIFYTLFMAWGDFERVKQRRIVMVGDRIRDPYILNRMAKQFAKKGMWATAVAHWQRAVGNASGSVEYLQNLARGYTQLGFYSRSIDTLETALEKAKHPKVRANIEKQIEIIQKVHKE